MSNLTELTVQIIAARAAKKEMSTDELQQEMQMVYSFLKGIESGDTPVTLQLTPLEEPVPQKINFKQIFKKDEVICLVCNKGFKTLKRHLSKAHQLTDKEYRTQFNIPAKQPLVAKAYSDKKKADAVNNNLGAKMQAGRRAKTVQNAVAAPDVEVAPEVVITTPVPAVRKKAAIPAVKVKASVPAKVAKKK
jgi:predicted transcriptional regulator